MFSEMRSPPQFRNLYTYYNIQKVIVGVFSTAFNALFGTNNMQKKMEIKNPNVTRY